MLEASNRVKVVTEVTDGQHTVLALGEQSHAGPGTSLSTGVGVSPMSHVHLGEEDGVHTVLGVFLDSSLQLQLEDRETPGAEQGEAAPGG